LNISMMRMRAPQQGHDGVSVSSAASAVRAASAETLGAGVPCADSDGIFTGLFPAPTPIAFCQAS
jgi:hypothetical protein